MRDVPLELRCEVPAVVTVTETVERANAVIPFLLEDDAAVVCRNGIVYACIPTEKTRNAWTNLSL